MPERTRVIAYQSALWDGPAVAPALWDLLQQKDLLIEIAAGPGPYAVTLGVPHHAAAGAERIAENWINPKTGQPGRSADETTGLFGLAVFTALQEKHIPCKLVIAAHPTDHDPNKTPGSPYWQNIFSSPDFGLLLELHGAASRRRHAIELSAGKNTLARPWIYGKALAYYWQSAEPLAVQQLPGVNRAWVYHRSLPVAEGSLQNPALETPSLVFAGQQGHPALHLEMKSAFRLPDPRFPAAPRPAPIAWELARSLANMLALVMQPDDIHISGAEPDLTTAAFLTRPVLEYQASYLSATHEAELAELADNPDLSIQSEDALRFFVQEAHQVILEGLPEDPPEEYLWLIDRGEFVGRVFFLHWLNEFRLKTDGQVDYWIRPSKRRQGYGRLILRLLLERYRQLGLQRILISCRSDNLPSRKIIEANGGIFESEIETPDFMGVPHPRLRYWIDVP